MRTAARMAGLGTETAFEAGARARALEAEGRSIVHFEIGEPDFETPPTVRAAAKAALDAGLTHYPPFAGLPELRSAIARDVSTRKAVPAEPANIFVTVGGKGVLLYAVLALVDPGDEVLIPDPGWPVYESLTRFVGGTPVPVTVRLDGRLGLDVDELARRITPRTRLLILNSPHNPTGSVLSQDDLERIAELAQRHDLVVLSDEIYSRITYDGAAHVSIASLPGMAERTVVLDGFSKTFAMTGWRLGYAVVPGWLAPAFGTLIINTVSGATAFAQAGAIDALAHAQQAVMAMTEEFRARRDFVVQALNDIPGLVCRRPDGAFYAFPSCAGTGMDGATFASRLLYEAGVCVLPGGSFGSGGRDHVRISYATSREQLEEGLRRIDAFVRSGAAAAGRPRR